MTFILFYRRVYNERPTTWSTLYNERSLYFVHIHAFHVATIWGNIVKVMLPVLGFEVLSKYDRGFVYLFASPTNNEYFKTYGSVDPSARRITYNPIIPWITLRCSIELLCGHRAKRSGNSVYERVLFLWHSRSRWIVQSLLHESRTTPTSMWGVFSFSRKTDWLLKHSGKNYSSKNSATSNMLV